ARVRAADVGSEAPDALGGRAPHAGVDVDAQGPRANARRRLPGIVRAEEPHGQRARRRLLRAARGATKNRARGIDVARGPLLALVVGRPAAAAGSAGASTTLGRGSLTAGGISNASNVASASMT